MWNGRRVKHHWKLFGAWAKRSWLLTKALLASLPFAVAIHADADPVRTFHTSVDLVSEVDSYVSGTTFDIGLRLSPDPGWHTYWINPGDAGKAAELKWNLPDGFSVGRLTFPTPGFVPFMGLLSYGYNEDTLLIATVEVPELTPDTVHLTAFASWLICDDQICIPESADLQLDLPKGNGSFVPELRTAFAAARALHPIAVDWPANFVGSYDEVTFEIGLPQDFSSWGEIHLFPEAEKLIDHAAPQALSSSDTTLRITGPSGVRQERTQASNAVLRFVGTEGRVQAFDVQAKRVEALSDDEFKPYSPTAIDVSKPSAPLENGSKGASGATDTFEWVTFLQALLAAMLGGLILNLMPCVLPILSLKALSVVEMSKLSKSDSQRAGLMYTAGVLVCFLAFAATLISLRAAGDFAGWAFHLQNPLIVSILSLVMIAVGLNFLGVFELRGSVSNWNVFSRLLSNKNNESFFTGLLAVIVASPCTVPFMAGALGYALVQPALVTVAIFIGLGIGFALPFLAISFMPNLQRVLPRPGAWMNSMRQVLAFPMLATAVWLWWILGRQAGVDSLVLTVIGSLALGFALWSWGISQQKPVWRWKIPGWIAAMLCAIAIYGSQTFVESPSTTGAAEDSYSQPWSESAVAELREQGRPVFAYFTADWCITCKVNERIAIKTDTVQSFFEDHNIAVLVGDWTNEDPDISAELERRGRAGVPVYLYWAPGGSDEPLILPSLLSPQVVVDDLTEAGIE